MTPPTPVIEETNFATGSPEAAREFFTDAFGDNELVVDSPLEDDATVSVHRIEAPAVNFSKVTLPAKFEIAMKGLDDEVLIASMQEGTTHVERKPSEPQPARTYGPGDILISNRPDAEWNHTTQPFVNTNIGVSEALLREVCGADPSDASRHLDAQSYEPRPGTENLWRETSAFLERLLAQPLTACAPLVIGPAQRVVAASVLTVFPNRLVGEPQMTDRRDAHPETLRRAIAFIEANPQMDISAADLANAAHASPRAVQLAFRRALDTTPTAYLRSVRLHHARRELLAAEPGAKVTEIALRWGFAGPSRFAEYYRREYGEKPSETLRR